MVKLHNVNLLEHAQEEEKILAAPANEKPLLSITDLALSGASKSSSPFEKSTPADGWKIMAHLGYQPGHRLGANLQGTLHPIHEPYQMGKEGLGYSGNFKSWTPLTWTLKAHFVQRPLNLGESSKESFDSESLSEYDSKSEEDLVDISELTSAFDWLFAHNQESSPTQDQLMEDSILGQSDQATNFEILIKIDFPQFVLILNINLNQ